MAPDLKRMKIQGLVDLDDHTPDKLKEETADHGLVFVFQPFKGKTAQVLDLN